MGLAAIIGEAIEDGGGLLPRLVFTVDVADGQLAFFVDNSASACDLDKEIVVDGVSYGSFDSRRPQRPGSYFIAAEAVT